MTRLVTAICFVCLHVRAHQISQRTLQRAILLVFHTVKQNENKSRTYVVVGWLDLALQTVARLHIITPVPSSTFSKKAARIGAAKLGSSSFMAM